MGAFLLQKSTILLILLDEFSRPAKKFSIITKSVNCNLYPRLLSFNVLEDRSNLINIPQRILSTLSHFTIGLNV